MPDWVLGTVLPKYTYSSLGNTLKLIPYVANYYNHKAIERPQWTHTQMITEPKQAQ